MVMMSYHFLIKKPGLLGLRETMVDVMIMAIVTPTATSRTYSTTI